MQHNSQFDCDIFSFKDVEHTNYGANSIASPSNDYLREPTAESLKPLIQGGSPTWLNQSWTSSFNTPMDSSMAMKRLSELNTDEKNVLLPSENATQSTSQHSSQSRSAKCLFSPSDKKLSLNESINWDHSLVSSDVAKLTETNNKSSDIAKLTETNNKSSDIAKLTETNNKSSDIAKLTETRNKCAMRNLDEFEVTPVANKSAIRSLDESFKTVEQLEATNHSIIIDRPKSPIFKTTKRKSKKSLSLRKSKKKKFNVNISELDDIVDKQIQENSLKSEAENSLKSKIYTENLLESKINAENLLKSEINTENSLKSEIYTEPLNNDERLLKTELILKSRKTSLENNTELQENINNQKLYTEKLHETINQELITNNQQLVQTCQKQDTTNSQKSFKNNSQHFSDSEKYSNTKTEVVLHKTTSKNDALTSKNEIDASTSKIDASTSKNDTLTSKNEIDALMALDLKYAENAAFIDELLAAEIPLKKPLQCVLYNAPKCALPVLKTEQLKQSALLLEKAKLSKKVSKVLPENQTKPVAFSQMVPLEEDLSDNDAEMELLLHLLEADENLFGTGKIEDCNVQQNKVQENNLVEDVKQGSHTSFSNVDTKVPIEETKIKSISIEENSIQFLRESKILQECEIEHDGLESSVQEQIIESSVHKIESTIKSNVQEQIIESNVQRTVSNNESSVQEQIIESSIQKIEPNILESTIESSVQEQIIESSVHKIESTIESRVQEQIIESNIESSVQESKGQSVMQTSTPINTRKRLKLTPSGNRGYSRRSVGLSRRSHKSDENLTTSTPITNKRSLPKIDETPISKNTMKIKLFDDFEHGENLGFATASGKNIAISESALHKAKNMLSERNLPQLEPKSLFKTDVSASGQNITVSESDSNTAKNILGEENITEETNKNQSKFIGFATASGKNVKLSESAMNKARNLFAEDLTNDELTRISFDSVKTDDNCSIDDYLLEQVSKLEEQAMENLKRKSPVGCKITSNTEGLSEIKNASRDTFKEFNDIQNTEGFQGFSTASGTKVKISENSLQLAKRKFAEMDNEPEIKFQGFSTASGTKVKISVEAMNAAKKKFDELENVDTIPEKTSGFQGFATASGNKVKISEKAMNAAKKKFDELENVETMPEKTSGFSTASGNTVKISESAIQAAKRKFKEMDNITENINKIRKIESEDSLEDELFLEGIKLLEENATLQKTEICNERKSPVLKKRTKILPVLKRKQLETARNEQEIKIKQKNTSQMTPGKILQIRRCANINLTQLKDLPIENGPVKPYISLVNAEFFKFKLQEITTVDNFIIIPNDSGEIGYIELEKSFLANITINNHLIPKNWFRNHYRLIIWKLNSMERFFPNTLSGYLNLETVIHQLKFRYDRENDLAQRSAIYKITTKDQYPANCKLVLCVAEICPNFVLTDGWYCIRAKIDNEMQKLINDHKVLIGTKLIIHGAELECTKNDGCLPLEQPKDLYLKIATNSTRRVKWYTKLGFHSYGPIKVNLSSVLAYGGLIGELNVSVAKIYPIVYAEKVDNKTIVRGQRAEQSVASRFEIEKQERFERILAEEKMKLKKEQDVEAANRRKSFSLMADCSNYDGESIYMALEADPDIHTSLTEDQRSLASEWKRDEMDRWAQCLDQRIQERMSNENKERNVSKLLKIRVVPIGEATPSSLLTIWNPDPDLIASLKSDACCIRIIGSVASGKRNGEICLNTIKTTKIIPQSPKPLHSTLSKTVTPIGALDDIKPTFNEVNIVGIVTEIKPIQHNNLQHVIMCDSIGYQVIICFWGGVKTHGLSDVLVPGVSIAGANLQCKTYKQSTLPCLYANEYSVFTRDPSEGFLKDALFKLRRTLDPNVAMKNLKTCLTPATQCSGGSFKSVDVKNRLSALEKYKEASKIAPLPLTASAKLSSKFKVPSSNVFKIADDESQALSLSQ